MDWRLDYHAIHRAVTEQVSDFDEFARQVRAYPGAGWALSSVRAFGDLIAGIGERHPYLRGLRAWAGFRQVEVPHVRERHRTGSAKYTAWKLADLAVPSRSPGPRSCSGSSS